MNYFNYFSEIEETFVRRRGRNLLLSPLDWSLIESWKERGIPLHIVLRGIEKVFDVVDKQPSRKRSIKGLSYCREEVEAQYAEWLESQVGRTASAPGPTEDEDSLFSGDSAEEHIRDVSDRLAAAAERSEGTLRDTLLMVRKELAEVGPETDQEKLESRLESLDAKVDKALLASFDTRKLEEEIIEHLSKYQNNMEPEVYRRTLDLMLLKRLREKEGIPRLSLFHL